MHIVDVLIIVGAVALFFAVMWKMYRDNTSAKIASGHREGKKDE